MGVGTARGSARTVLCLALLAAVAAATGCTTGSPPLVAATEPAPTSAPRPEANELTIGVDDIRTGFNPHTLADIGPISLGIAGLVLPSTFRQDTDGRLRPDPALVESAEVTAQQPFTVSYQLRREASWSDGAPIAAEDFAFLADRMRSEPGVVSPAGYRLIRQVNSRSGGKQVDVVFARPYPGWRTLFSGLLPSHLFKDAPGGWAQALETGIPVSGGPFAMREVDPALGTIVLERNDRFWGVPAVPDRLVLRRAEPAGLVSALATGGDQLAMLRADSIGMALLRERAPQLAVRPLPEPVAAELLLRPAGPQLSDRRVRLAVAAALDRDDLVRLGAGSGPAAELPAGALTLLPSQPGYGPTAPPGLPAMRADQDEVAELLTAAGYHRVGARWTRDGRPLRLVVAAPAERDTYRTLAGRVVRQLAAAGIDAALVTASGDDLFAALAEPVPAGSRRPSRSVPAGNSLGGRSDGTSSDGASTDGASTDGVAATTTTTSPTVTAGTGATSSTPSTTPSPVGAAEVAALGVDIAVVPRPVTGDPAADLVSWYGCPAATGIGTGPAQVDADEPANPAGYCNRSLQAGMDDLLTGAATLGETLPATEAVLWRDLPAVPLFQHAVVLVSGRSIDALRPGGLLAGPLADAARWRRTAR